MVFTVPIPATGVRRSLAWLVAILSGVLLLMAITFTPAFARESPPRDPSPSARTERSAESDGQAAWLARMPNVGNWAMDVVLGGGAAMLSTIDESLLYTVMQITGAEMPSLAPDCSGTLNILFCTPPDLFFDESGSIGRVLTVLWHALTPVSIGIITLLFLVRIGRVLLEGGVSLSGESKDLLWSFLLTLTFVRGSGWFFTLVLTLLNGLHIAIFSALGGDHPLALLEFAQLGTDLSFGGALAVCIFYVTLLILVVKAIARTVKLLVLIGLAPLMGALYFDRSTRPRFSAWIGRVADVLLQQTAWVAFLTIGGLLLMQGVGGSLDTPTRIVANLLGAMVIGMAIGGESLLAGIVGATGGSLGLAAVAARATQGYAMRLGRTGVRATAGLLPTIARAARNAPPAGAVLSPQPAPTEALPNRYAPTTVPAAPSVRAAAEMSPSPAPRRAVMLVRRGLQTRSLPRTRPVSPVVGVLSSDTTHE